MEFHLKLQLDTVALMVHWLLSFDIPNGIMPKTLCIFVQWHARKRFEFWFCYCKWLAPISLSASLHLCACEIAAAILRFDLSPNALECLSPTCCVHIIYFGMLVNTFSNVRHVLAMCVVLRRCLLTNTLALTGGHFLFLMWIKVHSKFSTHLFIGLCAMYRPYLVRWHDSILLWPPLWHFPAASHLSAMMDPIYINIQWLMPLLSRTNSSP